MFVINRKWREASLCLYLQSCDYKIVCTCFFKLLRGIVLVLLRVMNVVKTLILVLLICFSGKSLKYLMHLGVMQFLSSTEINLLKVT